MTPVARSYLPDLLSRAGGLPAMTAGEPVRFFQGRIYVAPPDHHLLLSEKAVWVDRGPRENLHRPSIDVLFRSAAGALGSRVIGVVLTGILDDGTAGLAAIKEAGGVAIVQDPREASFPGMPLNALHHVPVDYTLPLRAIPEALMELLRQPLGRRPARTKMGKRKSGSGDHRRSRTVKARPWR
jgi:two-component system chemotaxis response regulator CheB